MTTVIERPTEQAAALVAQDDGLLTRLEAGMPLVYGGNRVTRVPAAVAEAFRPGDKLIVVQTDGVVLHVAAEVASQVDEAVARARAAFAALADVGDNQVDRFYEAFAGALGDEAVWATIAEANAQDVERAKARGRSTTRLVADAKMRTRMVEALRLWRDLPPRRDVLAATVEHGGWVVEERLAGLGVIGFVFEGRPNVFADATGVLRSGNTTVMRIGSDALGTARAIAEHALRPALREAGVPEGAVELVERPEHAAGWALFSNPGLALAVARGSGAAVAQLGAIARQTGLPVSLHGTGGAWIVTDETAEAAHVESAVYHSLDSKKCNTLNTLCVVAAAAERLVPAALAGFRRRGEQLGHGFKLHVTEAAQPFVPSELFATRAPMLRAEGTVEETIAEPASDAALGTEWEWEGTPEVTLHVVEDVDEAVGLFNRRSPHLVASLLSTDQGAQDRFYRGIDAPFVGNGFTRWVDGQFALRRPELGLSNWQFGRLLARSGILTGDGVYTVRLRAIQDDPDVHV